jgi:hypothetical protein
LDLEGIAPKQKAGAYVPATDWYKIKNRHVPRRSNAGHGPSSEDDAFLAFPRRSPTGGAIMTAVPYTAEKDVPDRTQVPKPSPGPSGKPNKPEPGPGEKPGNASPDPGGVPDKDTGRERTDYG